MAQGSGGGGIGKTAKETRNGTEAPEKLDRSPPPTFMVNPLEWPTPAGEGGMAATNLFLYFLKKVTEWLLEEWKPLILCHSVYNCVWFLPGSPAPPVCG